MDGAGTWTETAITFVLSGGALAVVTAVIKGVRTRREGVQAAIRESIEDLADDRRAARKDAHFWESVARRYAHQLIAAGRQPDPAHPIPPSDHSGENASEPGKRPARNWEDE